MEQKNSVTPFGLMTQTLEHKRNNLEGREMSPVTGLTYAF